MDIATNTNPAEEIKQSKEQAQHPAALFAVTMFALTRPGTNGKIEYATTWGGWSDNIRDAHMRSNPDFLYPVKPADMTGAVTNKITIAVFERKDFDSNNFAPWDRVDVVVVAQRVDSFGMAVKVRRADGFGKVTERAEPNFITHSGVLGHFNAISDRVWQAETVNLHRNCTALAAQIERRPNRPDPRAFAFSEAVRVIHFAPVMAG